MASDPLSQVFLALADPTRRAILSRLMEGDATVGELAKPFDMSLPAISNHLNVLERAGLIRRRIEAQRRRCQLTREGLAAATDFIGRVTKYWEDGFEQLDRQLARALAKEGQGGD